MNRLRNLCACLALAAMAVPVAACTQLATAARVVSTATTSQPLGDRITMDERGMYAVEALYNVPAQAYVTADTRQVAGWARIKPTVRPLLIEARQVLLAVREAYRLGDETSFQARAARLRSLRERIMALIPATN